MLHPLYSCVSYLALMINGFISESVWFKRHVFLQYPLGPSILRELPCAPPPLSWRVLLGPLNLVLLPRAEGQLGATSNQGHAALGSLRDYWHLLSLSWHTGHWEQRLYGWQLSVRKAKVSQAQPRLQMSPEWSANCLVPWCSTEVEGRIPHAWLCSTSSEPLSTPEDLPVMILCLMHSQRAALRMLSAKCGCLAPRSH